MNFLGDSCKQIKISLSVNRKYFESVKCWPRYNPFCLKEGVSVCHIFAINRKTYFLIKSYTAGETRIYLHRYCKT